jgi:4-diphosphocytidyl-2-C-methyl-D-erythritol kinase
MDTTPGSYSAATLHAPCKINLFLDITRRRDDGYHELRSLFMPLPTPSDMLRITPAKTLNKPGLRLECSGLNCPEESNLVYKAYQGYRRETGLAPALRCKVEKNIPSGAGLGGGSSDAACMLSYLNRGAGPHALSRNRLKQLAASLGADVPFFLQDGPAWATGIGEKLRSVHVDFSGMVLLLVCPVESIPTRWAYGRWDEIDQKSNFGPHRFTGELTAPTQTGKDPLCLTQVVLYNSFEAAVLSAYPRLRTIKEMMISSGAAGAVMSGSGASLCALFADRDRAEKTADRLFKLDENRQMCFIHQL